MYSFPVNHGVNENNLVFKGNLTAVSIQSSITSQPEAESGNLERGREGGGDRQRNLIGIWVNVLI